MSKIIKIGINSILVIILINLSIYAILKYTNRVAIYRVQTGSMEEGIHVGDYIVIVRKKDYTVNDIVTYKRDNFYITHRIIKDNGDSVITKGDANNVEDKEISKKDIIGKVKYKGGILNFIIDYKLPIIISFIFIYLFTCYYNKEKEKSKEQNS